MTDERIIELLFMRDETAIKEAEAKYSGLCHSVAENFLTLREDREECVNDAFLALWKSIPPERPNDLAAYLAKIVRNISLNRTRDNNRWKRCANIGASGDELLEMISDSGNMASYYESRLVGEVINRFLEKLPKSKREVFVLRFWFGDTVPQICKITGFGESKVRSMLSRMREKLAEDLKKEGIIV